MQTKKQIPQDPQTALLAEIRDAASTLEASDRRHYPGWFRALLVKAARSSLSLSKIAEASGVTTVTLAKWLREAGPEPIFRKLTVLEAPESEAKPQRLHESSTSGMEIHFHEGFWVSLAPGMTPAEVAALVQALRAGARP